MAVEVIMPRQGQSVESCILTEWKKKVGDPIKAGEIFFSYETDKASFEEEAKADGTVLAEFFNEQDDIPCLQVVAVIGQPGEDISAFGPAKADAAPQAAPAAAPAPAPAVAPAPAAAPAERSKDATAVIMPRQGQSVESCILTEWKKKVGDTIKAGEIFFTYETDKASFEEEAKVDGTVLAEFFKEQDDIPCLTEIAVIGKPGTSVAGFGPQSAQEAAAAPAASPAAEAAPVQEAAPVKAEPTGPVCGISPRARNAAARLGVDLSTVSATGPHGRILERDILAAQKSTAAAAIAGGAAGIQGTGIGGRVTLADLAAAKTAPEAPAAEAAPAAVSAAAEADYVDEKIPNIRKAIAKNMCNSLSTMAQLTLNTSFDATEIVKYRGLLKTMEDEKLSKITFNDIMVFAVSRIVKNYPAINANWLDKEGVIRHFNHVHIGMAVDTPKGLFVPVIRNADMKTLAQISQEAKALAADAKAGKLGPDQMSGASITISNVGAFGIESFTPVINPPQTAILGVCGMEDKVRAGKDGQIELYKAMGLSLTIDHRALDGADGSRFLKELCTAMTKFSVLLAQ